ncbi:MAG TPA: hypothetical protein VFA03_06680 [Acetobacteraceae bacterium]|nr:hypothetical protein [Acetobacteraceae bacterium]
MRTLPAAAAVLALAAGPALAQGGPPPGPRGPHPMPPPEMWRMMHEMHEAGTAFRFKRGDQEIDIRCGADQPLQACVNAATTLMDKLASMNQSGGASATKTQ